ncbi:MAG: DUF3108 domain-containing protein [Candidatus Cloacimonetes bacterium]|nr:DUF3108 domain-containing protein [Candidatus Cloacimonadota bacterium]
MKFVYSIFLTLMITLLLSFQNNEKLTFKIKYGIISAAEAVLEVREELYRDSTEIYKISATTETNSVFDKVFKVRDYIESIWRKDDLVSLRFTKKLREGNYQQYRIHYYYPEQNLSIYMKYGRKSKTFNEKQMEIPERTQDIFSAFYWVRNHEFSVGDSIDVNVTVDGGNYVTRVNILEEEKVDTIFGKINCFKIEPILKGESIFNQTGRVFIWLTADEHKIPVLLESKIIFGSFRAILEKAENVALEIKE